MGDCSVMSGVLNLSGRQATLKDTCCRGWSIQISLP